MRIFYRLMATFLFLGLAACVGGYGEAHPNIIGNVHADASWDEFGYCGGWGCSDPSDAGFTAEEWIQVEAAFSPQAQSAEDELQQIAQAVGLMEGIIGPKTGYDRDKGGTASGMFQLGQLDCYSEATNTSNFLHLLDNSNLMRFHAPADPIMRGMGTSRSWRQTHATASIRNLETGTLIAMDSWFYDNGHAAVYVEADTWADAWGPGSGAIF